MNSTRSATRLTSRAAGAVLLAAAGLSAPFAGPAQAAATCTGTYTMTCLETTSVSSYDFVTHYSTQFVNKTNGPVTATCHVSTSKTTAAQISTTISVEAGVIFAKADASVSGSLERSVTSSAGTSTSFSVPAGATRNCKYGTSRSKVTGTSKKYGCSSQGCILNASGTWQVIGPKKLTWIIS